MKSRVLEIYSYSSEERETFRYLDDYMGVVTDCLRDKNVADLGFALAGLFLTYRACNHTGIHMTTVHEDIQFETDSLHFQRLSEFTALTGRNFVSRQEYFQLAGISWFSSIIHKPARMLLKIATSTD